MGKILSIHYGHNCTVAYAEHGNILCVLSEERIVRIKNAVGFPYAALKHIVDHFLSGSIDNVDHIAIVDGTGLSAKWLLKNGLNPARYSHYYHETKKTYLNKVLFNPIEKKTAYFRRELSKLYQSFKKNSEIDLDHRKDIIQKCGLPESKVGFYDHHTAHIAAGTCFPFIQEDKKRYLMFSMDAEGDGVSSSVTIFQNGEFNRISSNPVSVSLGYLYATTTSFLGMLSNEHEFKVMGMAPYADPKHVERLTALLRDLIWLKKEEGIFQTKISSDYYLGALFPLFSFERFDVICGAIQQLTEELTCQWVEFWVKRTGISDIALSGGVFMNVKAAKKIAELELVSSLFVVPSSADESLALGGLYLAHRSLNQKLVPISHLYWGREFNDQSIESMIVRDQLESIFIIEKYDQRKMADRIGLLLSQGEIVARCVGKEEWGARALGNRSILCDPSKFQNIERLNSQIKCRDFWMPFTPSVLAEDMHRYVINPKSISAKFMAITFESTPLARIHLAAAVHPRDFTMRAQEVTAEDNAGYHALISAFKKQTGVGAVLNTSFNLHGEPNVGSPEDAIRTVKNSGLKYVAIGSFLFEKREANLSLNSAAG